MFLSLFAGYRRANRASGGGQLVFNFFLEGPVLVTVNIKMFMLALTFSSNFLAPEKSSLTVPFFHQDLQYYCLAFSVIIISLVSTGAFFKSCLILCIQVRCFVWTLWKDNQSLTANCRTKSSRLLIASTLPATVFLVKYFACQKNIISEFKREYCYHHSLWMTGSFAACLAKVTLPVTACFPMHRFADSPLANILSFTYKTKQALHISQFFFQSWHKKVWYTCIYLAVKAIDQAKEVQ